MEEGRGVSGGTDHFLIVVEEFCRHDLVGVSSECMLDKGGELAMKCVCV